MNKEEFLELIKELRTTFNENEWCFRASEENVRAELIDPILSALGWKIPFLRREDHGKDYLLCSEKYVNKESMKFRHVFIAFTDEGHDSLMGAVWKS